MCCPRARFTTTLRVGATRHVGQDARGVARQPAGTRVGSSRQAPHASTAHRSRPRRWSVSSVDTMAASRSKGVSASLSRYPGLLAAVLITGAGLDDGVAAPPCSNRSIRKTFHVSTRSLPIASIIIMLSTPGSQTRPHWRIEVKTRPEGSEVSRHWRNAGGGAYQRLEWSLSAHSKDYERKPESSAAMISMSPSISCCASSRPTADLNFITETLLRSL